MKSEETTSNLELTYRKKMDLLIALIPMVILITIYWLGYKSFKKKHGVELASPSGLTPFGIHGWLAFFIFSSYYIAPVFSIAKLSSSFTKQEYQFPALISIPGYQTYKIISYLTLIVLIGWQITVAINLRNKLEPNSLKQAKRLCFTAPIMLAISDMIAGQITMSVTPNGDMLASYLGGFIGSYLWGAYFVWSKRCKNTYMPTSDTQELK